MSKISIIQPDLVQTHASFDQRLVSKGLFAAVAVSLVLVIFSLFLRPLIPVDETRYLTVAWEMFSTRDWLVPHLNGEPYSHKPPMLFWLINLAWFITGSNSEFIARLAPALFFPLNIFLTFLLGRKMGQPRQGAMAALILAGIAPFCIYASLVMFDSMLATAALLAIIGLVDATGNKPWRGFLLFGAAIGFGLLVKGPAIFLHVLPAALLAPLWVQHSKGGRMWYLSLLECVALGAAIGLAWAMPAAVSGGQEYGDMILWGQTTGRMVNSFDHARPFWFYAGILPLLLFPWILSRNFWAALRASKMARGDDRIQRLPWIVALGSFVLFSFVSGKQIHYLIPTLPFAALALARALETSGKVPSSEPGFAVLLFFLGLVAIFFGLFPTAIPKIHFGMNPWISALFFGMAIIAWMLRRQLFTLVLFTTAGIFLAGHLAGYLGTFNQFDLEWIGEELHANYPNAPVAYAGKYEGQFGFLGRLNNPVVVVPDAKASEWLKENPGGILVSSRTDFKKLVPWRAPDETKPYRQGSISIWLPSNDPQRFSALQRN